MTYESILMLVILIAVFYFLLIRPENKRKKQAQAMRDSLKKGDVITTIGGIIGKIAVSYTHLHFTPELLEKIAAKGVGIGYVTLHVGLGTFRPVKEEEIEDHPMHSEFCTISQETADLINRTRANGGRCICVGTTSCRTLESWAAEDGHMEAKSGWTNTVSYTHLPPRR